MTWEFSDRVQRVEPSATVSISNRASALRDAGHDVVNLSVGEPDFEPPSNVLEAGKRAMDEGHNGYTQSSGIPALKEAIRDSFQDDGLAYSTDQILVTPGGKQALFEVILALIERGDEVVLFDPAWVSYEAIVKIAGGSLSRIDLSPHSFALEPAIDELTEAVSDSTKLIIVNSPGNPSGAVFSERALEAVRDIAVDHDCLVIADEIYKDITYGDSYTHFGALPGAIDRAITINGFSKAYAMTGWRLGYVGAPADVISTVGTLHTHSVTCAVNHVQHAGVEALRNASESVNEMVAAFRERRDLVVELLHDRGREIPPPAGAFYAMVPVADDDTEWCERAIEEAHVATVPGSAFGTPGYARFSYANSQSRLNEAFERLDNASLL